MSTQAPPRPEWDVRSPTVLPPGLPLNRRRQLFASWVSATFTGAVTRPLVLFLDLDEYALEVGELNELIVRVGADLRGHRFGQLLLVVTTRDRAVQEVVRSLAATHDVPIYIAPSRQELDQVAPAVDLTPSQRSVLDAVGVHGRATVAVVAGTVGAQSAAVGNVLAHLSNVGLLLRAEGAGRVGHTYLHPRVVETTPAAEPLTTSVEIPDALSEEIAAVASRAGREPGDLLAEAWRDFLIRNDEAMAARYREMAEMVRQNDRQGLIEAATRAVPSRARATRPRDNA